MRKHLRLAAAIAGIAAVGTFGSSPAYAAIGATVTPSSNVTDGQLLTVNWSGYTNGQLVSIAICKKSIADATFSPANDCDYDTSLSRNSNATGAGTATNLQAFVGTNPTTGEWACLPVSAADPGVPRFSTCYVRVAGNAYADVSADFEVPITFGAGAVVPEAPYALLLSLGAVGVLGGGYFVMRNRRSLNAL